MPQHTNADTEPGVAVSEVTGPVQRVYTPAGQHAAETRIAASFHTAVLAAVSSVMHT